MDQPIKNAEVVGGSRRLRLSDRDRELWPFQRAQQLTRCFLYWMPVRSFPMPAGQKSWLFSFLDRVTEQIAKPLALRTEFFLQMKVIYPDLFQAFVKSAQALKPVVGLSRRPGAKLPAPLTFEDIKAISEGRETFDFKKAVPDYCYWFLNKDHRRLCQEFGGNGGVTIVLLKPDPQTVPPELPISPGLRKKSGILRMFDIDALVASTFALRDSFLPKSKELFGVGLENEAGYPGIPFILPLLSSSDFLKQPDSESERWFQLFDLYIAESPSDQGILLASKTDIEEKLIRLLKQMTEENLVYVGSD